MACSSSDREQTDPVKQQVAAHWDRRAAHFDEDFGHSIRTAAERAAWDRILDLILPAGDRRLEDPLFHQPQSSGRHQHENPRRPGAAPEEIAVLLT
jgi:hypothetical protein